MANKWGVRASVILGWLVVEVRQGDREKRVEVVHQPGQDYVLYQAMPNTEAVIIHSVQP
jgi:hypothetical protein